MAFTYPDLEAAIHIELKNLSGVDAIAAQTVMESPITPARLLRPDYPQENVRRAALASVFEIVKAICETDKHPDRVLFAIDEGPIMQNRAGVLLQPSMGPYGAFRDATSGEPLRRASMAMVSRLLDPDLASIFDPMLHHAFALQGQKVWFKCPASSARYERYGFTELTIDVAFTWTINPIPELSIAKVATPLGQEYFQAATSGAVRALALKTDPALAGVHAGYFSDAIGMIKSGAPYKPPILPPLPKQ